MSSFIGSVNILKAAIMSLSSIVSIILSGIVDGRLTIPLALNTTINATILLTNTQKRKMNIQTLSARTIMWLAYLSNTDKPCGIIHNTTNEVVWCNSRSGLEIGTKTTETFIDKEKLYTLQNVIHGLECVNVSERHTQMYQMNYLLHIKDRTEEIIDNFYKCIIDGEEFRIFVEEHSRVI